MFGESRRQTPTHTPPSAPRISGLFVRSIGLFIIFWVYSSFVFSLYTSRSYRILHIAPRDIPPPPRPHHHHHHHHHHHARIPRVSPRARPLGVTASTSQMLALGGPVTARAPFEEGGTGSLMDQARASVGQQMTVEYELAACKLTVAAGPPVHRGVEAARHLLMNWVGSRDSR